MSESPLSSSEYAHLRAIAGRHAACRPPGATLQPTAVVHEALLKLSALEGNGRLRWSSDEHFLAAAATAIRHILVDQARRRATRERVIARSLETPGETTHELDLIELHDQLDRLARLDERAARVVELRFFAGLTAAQTAKVLSASISTVESDWRHARAWLAGMLSAPR